MKKFLFIFILLFSTNSFAEIIEFKSCNNKEGIAKKKPNINIEIDLENNLLNISGFNNGLFIKGDIKFMKVNEAKIYKIDDKTIKLETLDLMPKGHIYREYTFGLDARAYNERYISFLNTGKVSEEYSDWFECKSVSSTKDAEISSGAKSLLEKLLGNN
tara:strand:+ start:1043 stop:1519 length:477 start_codon:yes stop_codon:yes gene_type:complete